MKRQPKLAKRAEVAKHLHNHIAVTEAELDAFINDDHAVRLLVLAELRSRAADQETSLVLTLEAAAIAVLALLMSRIPIDEAGAPAPQSGWTSAVTLGILYAVLGVFAIVLILPSVWHAVKGNRDKARAVVWLGAYEQALADSKRTAPPPRWSFRSRR